MTELTCPKCQATMRQYERNGVTVDQCTECRGLFLDRGELERLISAEEQWNDAQFAAAPPPRGSRRSPGSPPSPDERYGYRPDPRYEQRGYSGHGSGYDPRHHKRKKKRSFLDDFLDF